MQIHHNRINLDLHRLWEFNDTYLAIKMALAQHWFQSAIFKAKHHHITLHCLPSKHTFICLIKEFRFVETYTPLIWWPEMMSVVSLSVHYRVSVGVPGLSSQYLPGRAALLLRHFVPAPRGEGGQPGHWKHRGNVWWSLMITSWNIKRFVLWL